MRKKNNNNIIAIAILQTDLLWIKNMLTKLDEKVSGIKACVNTHDIRIVQLEQWKKLQSEQFNKEMTKMGVVIGVIAIVISVVLHFW